MRTALFEMHDEISIHAPHEGSDKLNDESHTASNISIHAPHEGERPAGVYDENCEALFQSTLPTRGSDGAA